MAGAQKVDRKIRFFRAILCLNFLNFFFEERNSEVISPAFIEFKQRIFPE